MTRFQITQLRLGRVQPFGPKGTPSAIDKQPVSAAVWAGFQGLEGDEQGDLRHHGGPDKAIHAYAAQNYSLWQADLPTRADRFQPGAFGENLVAEGLDEHDICLGDHWQIGGALLAVSQGRQPCWKLNLRFDQPDMAHRVQDSGRTGWYFRTLVPGLIGPSETAQLVARPNPDWSIARVTDLLYHDRMNRKALATLAQLPDLPESWHRLVQARLDNGHPEDWSQRITTPD